MPDCNKKTPLYDSAATIGDTTDGKAPNITGKFGHANKNQALDVKGCISVVGYSGVSRSFMQDTTNNTAFYVVDASRNSTVYDDNATGIIPAGVYVLFCIKY